MPRVFLSIGSNLGDRRQCLEQALRVLGDLDGIRVIACSQFYETEPWPEIRATRERWLLNCAVEIETGLSPYGLLRLVQQIEDEAGCIRSSGLAGPFGDRTLDIDILLYGDRVLSDDRLQIPHPLLHERRFVLAPLADIAPEFEHPTLYQTIREILDEVTDPGRIFPYSR